MKCNPCGANVPPVVVYANTEGGSLLRVSMPLKFSGQVRFFARAAPGYRGLGHKEFVWGVEIILNMGLGNQIRDNRTSSFLQLSVSGGPRLATQNAR
ncbi:MAG TPA: hypothetical protein VK818_13920 [Methylomirabilota bacterium]|nr:hypothetical protein [Methylomirabilota bacterium]